MTCDARSHTGLRCVRADTHNGSDNGQWHFGYTMLGDRWEWQGDYLNQHPTPTPKDKP